MTGLSETCHSITGAGMTVKSQLPCPARHRTREPMHSNPSVFSERECIFHIDAEIADGIVYLAMVEKDLDGT